MSAIDSLSTPTSAFQRLVADGGHVVEEWFLGVGAHDSEEDVVAYGDCSLCLTELQLRFGPSGAKPSEEAAAPCPAAVGSIDEAEDDSDWL